MNIGLKKLLLCLTITLISSSLYSADTESNYFSQEEYNHYMHLIKLLNVGTYNKLKSCESALGHPCIEKSKASIPSVEPDPEYPIISLPSIKHISEKDQMYILRNVINEYNRIKNILHITKTEQKTILKGIKKIAPELYAAIVKRDPTGQHHVKRSYDSEFALGISKDDGLPVILIDQDILQFFEDKKLENEKLEDKEMLLAAIAHELGHYVSEDFLINDQSSHTFKPTKQFAHAYTRTQEYEADKSEVLDFGIDIESAIALAQVLQDKQQEPSLKQPSRKTFKRTHPFWYDRIAHLESLRPEVELKRLHGKKRTVFDWEALADKYWKVVSK